MIASGISSLKPEAVASKVSSYKRSRPEDNFQFQLVVIHVVAFFVGIAVLHCRSDKWHAQKAIAQKVAWLSKVGDMCHCHLCILAL